MDKRENSRGEETGDENRREEEEGREGNTRSEMR